MVASKLRPVKDRFLRRLSSKLYRDSYLETLVRSWIAYQIKGIREACSLSQVDFATKVQKPQSVISRLENTEYGKVTIQTLLDIAKASNVALLVRFCSYPELIAATEDKSSRGLHAETIQDSLKSVGGEPTIDSSEDLLSLSGLADPLSHQAAITGSIYVTKGVSAYLPSQLSKQITIRLNRQPIFSSFSARAYPEITRSEARFS